MLHKSHPSHSWQDVSHHGSPFYACEYCHVYNWNEPESSLPCPKAEERLREKAEKEAQEELWEYQRLKAAHERWEYLKAKYEKPARGFEDNIEIVDDDATTKYRDKYNYTFDADENYPGSGVVS